MNIATLSPMLVSNILPPETIIADNAIHKKNAIPISNGLSRKGFNNSAAANNGINKKLNRAVIIIKMVRPAIENSLGPGFSYSK
jgi:hypothetical protein